MFGPATKAFRFAGETDQDGEGSTEKKPGTSPAPDGAASAAAADLLVPISSMLTVTAALTWTEKKHGHDALFWDNIG